MTGVPNLSLNTYPFSISTEEHEHVPLKFLVTNRLRIITKSTAFLIELSDFWNYKGDIHWYMCKCLEINNIIYFPSISNHKCTPSDRQMYPRLGTPALCNGPCVWVKRTNKNTATWQAIFPKISYSLTTQLLHKQTLKMARSNIFQPGPTAHSPQHSAH